MSTLSKLEHVSSIGIVSSLSKVRTKIAPMAEITLDFEALQRLDYIENPKVYIEIVIGQWEAGKSQLTPTWSHLFSVLQKLNLQTVGQEIEDYMRGNWFNLDIRPLCKYSRITAEIGMLRHATQKMQKQPNWASFVPSRCPHYPCFEGILWSRPSKQ